MTLRSDLLGDAAPLARTAPRGAAPVGYLTELPPIEAAAVLYFRSWCEGGEARDRIGSDFRLILDPVAAEYAVAHFDALMQTVLCGARRPVMRHGLDCRCFGGDESAFANMVAAAAGGDEADAMLFAAGLLCAPAAEEAVRLAGCLRPLFLRVATMTRRPAPATYDIPADCKH
jgi:hypothetical protein